MLYPLSQQRARFNRNKERVEKIVLRHRREKVALSEAAAVAIQGATRALILRLDGLYNAALDTAEVQEAPPPATPPRPAPTTRPASVSPTTSIVTPPTAKRTVQRVLSRSEMAVQALGSRHGMAVIAVEEAVGPVESYPSRRNYDVQTLIRSKALDYNGRFVLLTWLVAEGCSPVLVVELMLAAGSLKNQAAFDHVLSMLHAISQNKFKYKAYCRLTRSWEQARPAIGTGSYWAEAIGKMKSARNYAPRS